MLIGFSSVNLASVGTRCHVLQKVVIVHVTNHICCATKDDLSPTAAHRFLKQTVEIRQQINATASASPSGLAIRSQRNTDQKAYEYRLLSFFLRRYNGCSFNTGKKLWRCFQRMHKLALCK